MASLPYNHAFAVEFGLDMGDDPKSYNFREFIADVKEAERVRDAVVQHLTFSGETTGRRQNGETFPMYLTLALMKNEEDGTFGAMAVGRDITEAKIAQQELEASEKRYRNILEGANDAIFTLDDQGYFTYVNPSFNELRGYSAIERSKRTVHDVRQGLPKRGKTWMKALEGAREERKFVAADGQVLTMLGGQACRRIPKESPRACVAFS